MKVYTLNFQESNQLNIKRMKFGMINKCQKNRRKKIIKTKEEITRTLNLYLTCILKNGYDSKNNTIVYLKYEQFVVYKLQFNKAAF